MGDDREFIDLDTTLNWSQLDVKRELDNLEVDEATGKRYDFARGFSDDKKQEEDKVLLDGLTSGLNYIPEELLMSADEKKDIEMEAKPQEEKPDVSWAYRDASESSDDDEPFIPIVELKRAEAEATKAADAAKDAKQAEIEAVRAKNLEEQARRIKEANASDDIVKANIEARKKAREAIAAQNEAAIKARAEARKAAQKQAEIDMYKEQQILDLDDLDIPVMTKEERIAAANKNRHNVTEEIVLDEKEIPATEEVSEVTYEMDELEQAQITSELEKDKIREKVLSTGDTGVIYIDDDEEQEEEETEEEVVIVKKKKKKAAAAAAEYAVWAEEEDEAPVRKKKKKKKAEIEDAEQYDEDEDEELVYGGFMDKVVAFFSNMSGLDYLVAVTGVLVVLVAIVATIMYSSSKATNEKISEFASLGQKMQMIENTGSEKLVSVADAKKYAAEVVEEEEPEEEEPVEYNEKDDETVIRVTMTLTSVKKDLKIKFINDKTKKLVGNREFKVSIEDSKGKKTTEKDDNMDGIIYLKSVEPGKAKVTMLEIDDSKDLTYSREAVPITIKENIDYKKIDVADEVKKESEINAKAEDTAVGQKTEGELTDTVEWVESSKTATPDGYTSVNKKNIVDPAKAVSPTATPAKTAKVDHANVTDRSAAANKEVPAPYTLSRPMSEPGEGGGEEPPVDDGAELTKGAQDAEATKGAQDAEATKGAQDAEATKGAQDAEATKGASDAEATKGAQDAEATKAAAGAELTKAAAAEATKKATGDAAATKAAAGAAPTLTAQAKATAGAAAPTLTAQAKATGAVNSPKNDKTTPLKDKDGNQLYIKEADGTYREAKSADYYTAKEFFRKGGEYKYTGWQEIDGQTYYFDKNGNKVTGEQVIKGAKYNFDSTGALVKGSGTMGIDVSKWNGSIDWKAVKNSGVSFVIIRCGYRGSSSGALVEDPKFRTNIKGATDAGLKVGVYFFSQAVTDVEAVEEASMAISLMKGYKVSYPVFLDVEDSGGRGDRIDASTRTTVIKAFCETVKNSGYTPGVYANKSWLSTKMNVSSLNGYKIWLAQYNTQPTYSGKYDLWQYSSKGSVSGIGGNTDLNLSYLGY